MKTAATIALIGLLACLIFWTGYAFRGRYQPDPEPHTVVTVRVDTVSQTVPLPVPYPVPGKDRVTHSTTRETTTVYVQVPDTVYAECDSARRYTAYHSDSTGAVLYTADVCGRILSHNFRLTAYPRTTTVVRTVAGSPVPAHALYAVASSDVALGIQYVRPAWLAGYQYAPTPEPTMRHSLTVGVRILNLSRERQ
jgi:hypothetical protein